MHDNHSSDRRSRSGSGSRERRTRGGSGGRDSNRGGRRDSSSRGGRETSRNTYSSSNQPSRPQLPKKVSFWQKLVRLFTGKPKSSSRSSSSSSRTLAGHPRIAASDAAAEREPSSNGHRRFESADAPARQSRKPELVEVSSPKIYVGNLSFDATEGDLFELFNGVGKVQNAEIVSNKYTMKSKGFAFVTMLTVDEARRAVTELHDKDFMGRKLVVSGAKTSDVGRESRPPEAAPEAEEEAHEDIAPAS